MHFAQFRLLAYLTAGIVGAVIGSLLLPSLGVHLGAGTVASIADAAIGAVILLLLIRLARHVVLPRM